MAQTVQAVRGMKDLLPEEAALWQAIEAIIAQVLGQFGYRPIRLPILEKTMLFERSIGEVTDIVEKEMYTFVDRNGESLTLRPEGTAGCVRSGIEHGLFYNQLQRLWYTGSMFRHERPQKGRYRQFYQVGVEAFGMADPEIDAELIALCALLWQRLGVAAHLTLELNTLGDSNARARHKEALVAYFTAHYEHLDEDSQRRLSTNPLRILDSKNPSMQAIVQKAPVLMDYLEPEALEHFERLRAHLEALNIAYVINPRLVRGLDYYNRTVFEWTTESLGAQGTVAAGGRFDGLVAQLGGANTPAVGFALGLERLMELVALVPPALPSLDAYVVVAGSDATLKQAALQLVQTLRAEIPTARIEMDCTGGSLKSQMKRADKSGARVALILGEEERAMQEVTVKLLREESAQARVAWHNLKTVIGG